MRTLWRWRYHQLIDSVRWVVVRHSVRCGPWGGATEARHQRYVSNTYITFPKILNMIMARAYIYGYLCGFFCFFLFSTPLISEVTERISTKLGHIHLWLLFEIFGLNAPGIYPLPHGLGAIKRFWDRSELWPNISLQWNIQHNINNRKETCRSAWSPTHIWRTFNFGPETAKNGWWGWHTLLFFHWETLSALPHGRYLTDRRQTLAVLAFGTFYVGYVGVGLVVAGTSLHAV